MSTAEQIAYLNQVKTNNSNQITANSTAISGIESLNSDLSAQIASNETQITSLEAANTQLTADNVLIDDIIAVLSE